MRRIIPCLIIFTEYRHFKIKELPNFTVAGSQLYAETFQTNEKFRNRHSQAGAVFSG